jgi:hypothetical protein
MMPSDPFLLCTPRDMLEKAKRDLVRLRAEPNADSVFNFFVTAYHIMDYVRELGTISQSAMDSMYADIDFDLCRFICNRGKHLIVRKDPKTVETRRTAGAVLGKMQLGDPGAALGTEPRWQFFCDNKEIDPLQLGQTLVKKWETFFTVNGIA